MKAVCDSFTGHLARGKDKVQSIQKTTPDTYDDYRRLLEDKSIDAVFIMTPEHLHRDMVIAALEAGKHVYCEKPLTHTIEEGHEILKVVRRRARSCRLARSAGVLCSTRRRARFISRGVSAR